jgi:hypothetical protein
MAITPDLILRLFLERGLPRDTPRAREAVRILLEFDGWFEQDPEERVWRNGDKKIKVTLNEVHYWDHFQTLFPPHRLSLKKYLLRACSRAYKMESGRMLAARPRMAWHMLKATAGAGSASAIKRAVELDFEERGPISELHPLLAELRAAGRVHPVVQAVLSDIIWSEPWPHGDRPFVLVPEPTYADGTERSGREHNYVSPNLPRDEHGLAAYHELARFMADYKLVPARWQVNLPSKIKRPDMGTVPMVQLLLDAALGGTLRISKK